MFRFLLTDSKNSSLDVRERELIVAADLSLRQSVFATGSEGSYQLPGETGACICAKSEQADIL